MASVMGCNSVLKLQLLLLAILFICKEADKAIRFGQYYPLNITNTKTSTGVFDYGQFWDLVG
jgi:hypothetical protein